MSADQTIIQTKWLSAPTKVDNYLHPVDAPAKSRKKSLERLKVDYVDIHLVRGPIHPQSIARAAEGMVKCVELGLTKAVGVANHDRDDMLEMKAELLKYGVPLAVN
jgi:diketogulonate reductase-like aldo/keto reductase